MIKVFLSHSWAQKKYVDQIADYLGRDYSIVDRFTFESGRKIKEEIQKSIDMASIFVFLISNECLDSEWCNEEIKIVRDLIDEKKCYFCSFIIDPSISVKDSRIKPWIRNYLTNYYESPQTLSRVIKRSIREIVWTNFPSLAIRQRVFVGRDDDFKTIMGKMYGKMDSNIHCVVASGLPHIGRKRFLQELLNTKMNNELHPSYEPFDISLNDCDSIDVFIKQLNELVTLYSTPELNTLLADPSSYKKVAVNLINKTINLHERIRISDDRCIINTNGYYEDWFLDIINDENITNTVCFFIASTCSVNPSAQRDTKRSVSIQLKNLSKQDTKVLFNQYSTAMSVVCDDNTTDDLLSKLAGYPEQVFMLVDVLKDYGIPGAQNDIPQIQKCFDSDINKIIGEFSDNHKEMQLLIILSKFPSIKFDELKRIFSDDDFDIIINKMQRFGVFETFGTNRQYIRMSHILADYISRYDLRLDKQYQDTIKEYISSLIENTDVSELDWAEEIVRGKALLTDSRFKIDQIDYLLPSAALQCIIEQYRLGNYLNVVELATKLLYEHNRLEYESMKRSVRYWLCLSYCKLGADYREKLDSEVVNFSGYTKYFLLGYFERLLGNYPQAQHFFELALDCNKKAGEHTSKAAHELVIAKMKQGHYEDALEQAKSNYEIAPNNVYHIDAYYRCYVRSPKPDKNILKKLIKDMKESYDSGKNVFVDIFEAEYLHYIEHRPQDAVTKLLGILDTEQGRNSPYATESLYLICKRQDMMTVFDSEMKKRGLKKKFK